MKSDKKIAIMGANYSILPLIRKAKEKGYETHVFSWACGDYGETEADVFHPISISEKEKILDECKEIGICGVASITSDFAVPTVNYVARNLGLVGNSEKTDLYARNKYYMRCAFRDAGLFVPRFCQVKSTQELENLKFDYPVIVKPTDAWSSRAVSKVDKKEDLETAVDAAIKQSICGYAIIESYIEGPEYSAESISYKGEHHLLTFTKKQTTGTPHFVELGHVQPSDIPETKQEEIKNKVYTALDALDIKNGASHAEFRIMANGDICFMEIGARMGGDRIGTDLVPNSTGMDFVGMVVDVACGNVPSLKPVNTPTPVCIKFVTTQNDLDYLAYIKKNNPDLLISESPMENNLGKEITSSNSRCGYFIMKFDTER